MCALHLPSTPDNRGFDRAHFPQTDVQHPSSTARIEHLPTWISCSRSGGTRDGGIQDDVCLFSKLDMAGSTALVGADDVQPLSTHMQGLDAPQATKHETIEAMYGDIRRVRVERAVKSKIIVSKRCDRWVQPVNTGGPRPTPRYPGKRV